MKKTLVRLSAFLLVLMLAASLSVSVFAEDELVEWSLSSDGTTLTRDDGRVYYLIGEEPGVYIYNFTTYIFANSVPYGTIFATHRDSEIVCIDSSYEEPRIYATQKGYEYIKALTEGTASKYRLNTNGYYDTDLLPDAFVASLDAYEDIGYTVTIDVKDLKNLSEAIYEVVATDETETLGFVHGAIYLIQGSYYYLSYEDLPNNFFDADGNFSYRKGEVNVVLLEETLTAATDSALYTLKQQPMDNVWEDDSFDFGAVDSDETNMVVFWIFYSLIGFVAPLPILIVGVVLANRRKYKSKYWYVMSGTAGAWILLSVILMLLFILL